MSPYKVEIKAEIVQTSQVLRTKMSLSVDRKSQTVDRFQRQGKVLIKKPT